MMNNTLNKQNSHITNTISSLTNPQENHAVSICQKWNRLRNWERCLLTASPASCSISLSLSLCLCCMLGSVVWCGVWEGVREHLICKHFFSTHMVIYWSSLTHYSFFQPNDQHQFLNSCVTLSKLFTQ